MDVKKVALEGLQMIEQCSSFDEPGAKMAFNGFFKGVSEGTITVGQRWMAELIIRSNWKTEQQDVLTRVFASGMCCEGQALGDTRGKTFTERNT